MESKECRCCHLYKSVTDFNKDKSRDDGLCIYCRDCSRAKYKKIYHSNDAVLNSIRQRRAGWEKKKKKEVKLAKRAESKVYTEKMTDSYIKKLLITRDYVAKEEITPEMIKSKRERLIEYRKRRSSM